MSVFVQPDDDADIVKVEVISVSSFSRDESETPSLHSLEITTIPDDFETMLCGLLQEEKRFVLGWEYSTRLESRPVEASAREESIAWIHKVGFRIGTNRASIRFRNRPMSRYLLLVIYLIFVRLVCRCLRSTDFNR